jgi:hypothetical protein
VIVSPAPNAGNSFFVTNSSLTNFIKSAMIILIMVLN